MCRFVLKFVVFMTVSNCFYVTTAETGKGVGKINIKFDTEPTELKKILNCSHSDEPLGKWNNSTPLVISADGNSVVHWSIGHVIQLRIVQYNVPEYFTWINVMLKNRYSEHNSFLEEDINVQNYEKCLQLKETCDDIVKIDYTSATSHIIFITKGGFKKKLYDLKYKPDFKRGGSNGDIVHQVVYLVDWKTGCDAIIINSTNFAAEAITFPKHEAKIGTVLNEAHPVSSSSSLLSSGVTKSIASNNQGYTAWIVLTGVNSFIIFVGCMASLWWIRMRSTRVQTIADRPRLSTPPLEKEPELYYSVPFEREMPRRPQIYPFNR